MAQASADGERDRGFRLALLDRDFLLGPAMRGRCLLAGFTTAEKALKAADIASTILVLGGSAMRFAEDGAAARAALAGEGLGAG